MGTFYGHIAGMRAVSDRFNSGTAYGGNSGDNNSEEKITEKSHRDGENAHFSSSVFLPQRRCTNFPWGEDSTGV